MRRKLSVCPDPKSSARAPQIRSNFNNNPDRQDGSNAEASDGLGTRA
jgi:hypothetical protein